MNFFKWKLNLSIISMTVMIMIVIISFDGNKLNSIVTNRLLTNVLVVDNINTVNINNNESNEDSAKVSSDAGSKVTMMNNNVSDKWTFPVEGNYAITTYFNSSHKAIDIYSYKGYNSNIIAANNGTVITASGNCNNQGSSCNGRRGNYVVVKHNVGNYYTVYMHLNRILVSVGENVSTGQVIATMGNTGYVIPAKSESNPYAGTHLHFCLFIGEPYNGGYPVNPFNVY